MNSLKVILVSFVLFFLSFNPKNFAQGEAAVPFLLLEQSPMLLGMGWTGTSLPNDEPSGFYYNPAMLGHSSQHNNLSFQFYPSETKWIFDQITYNSYAFNVGYKFKKQLNGLNLSVGFGYIYNKFDYGEFVITGEDSPEPIGTFNSYDEFSAYAIGIGLDYYIQMSAGITFKDVYSKLIDQPTSSTLTDVDASVTAIDYGLLFTVPVVELAFDNPSFYFLNKIPAKPFFDISLGFSQSNFGDEIWYIDPVQKDPLPRTTKLSYTASTGIDLELENLTLNLFTYDFTVDADDILIERDSSGFTYQSFLGDIDIPRNLIALKGGDVIIHKGHRVSLLETFVFYNGSMSGRGFDDVPESSGFGIRANGLLKIISQNFENEILSYLANHFDIAYFNSSLLRSYHFSEVEMEGITINFSNIYF